MGGSNRRAGAGSGRLLYGRSQMKRSRSWAVAAVVAGALSAPAMADRLVTVDGTSMETRGPWEVRSGLVVFTDARGRLRSLPASEVDLEASREATTLAETETTALRPAAPGASLAAVAEATRRDREGRPAAVVVLTDDDVMRVDPEITAARAAIEATGDVAAEGEARESATRRPYRLPPVTLYATSWCPWCRRARGLLLALGVPFTEKDIEASASAAMEMRRKAGPGGGVPVLDVGGAILRGYDQDRITRVILQKATELSHGR